MAKKLETALQYVAFVRQEKRRFHILFPDAPGCEAITDTQEAVYPKAKDAIESWLRNQLKTDAMPSWPQLHRVPHEDERRVHVTLTPSLALAVQFRLMRREEGWSQTQLAARVGVSQQQVAKLEDPDGNPTVETITKVATAFHRRLMVVFGDEVPGERCD
jgi:DNA-binding XRE family transcriptional regulator/predicted RNase H-like HicB family nuclease